MLVVLAFVTLVLLWEGAVRVFALPEYLVPTPQAVLEALVSDGSLLWQHFLYTASEWLLGLVLGVALAVLIALSCFYSSSMRRLLRPLLVVSQSVPYLVFAPLLLLWLGLGLTPKVVLVVLTCVFPVALNFEEGLSDARSEYSLLVRMLRFSKLTALIHIYLPAALPQFFSGLKVTTTYAFVAAVLAELIGSEAGLGVYISRAQSSYRPDRVLAAVLLVVAISIVSNAVVARIQKRAVFWPVVRK